MSLTFRLTVYVHWRFIINVSVTIRASSSDEFIWHEDYRLLYVLNGSAQIDTVSNNYELLTDQMIFFNPFDVYSIHMQAEGILLEVSIDIRFLDADAADQRPRFSCNSRSTDNAEGYLKMRQTLARIVKIWNDGGDNIEFALKAQINQMFYILSSHFPGTQELSGIKPRILDVLNYLNLHCCEYITLQSTADRFYISAAHLSRLFKQQLGLTFTEYLNNVRVSRSVTALISGDATITLLSEQCGFPGARSYRAAFLHKYGISPLEYRRAAREKTGKLQQLTQLSSSYLESLAKYLTEETIPVTQVNDLPTMIVQIPAIDASQKGAALGDAHNKLTAIGRASQLLDANNQTYLREMQREIGFQYIKFHGLLDDDMMVYHETDDGIEAYNFSHIDTAFDFLLEINLKPFIQICFMPKLLAAVTDRIIHLGSSVISLPKSLAKWNRLISGLFHHLVERYGISAILDWPVYIWNLPDNPNFVFGIQDKQGFFNFYSETYKTIKLVHRGIKIGTPSIIYESVAADNWLDQFMEHCQTADTIPEFLCLNAFAVESANKSKILNGIEGLVKSTDPDFIKKQLNSVRRTLKSKPYNFSEIYVVEWNLALIRENEQELLNDMAFKAVYIVKTILDNHKTVSSLCHWTFSDSLREVWNNGQVFNGGNGLFTFNGIKKSAYYAFVILSALKPRVIDINDGYIATKQNEEDSYAFIFYNYQHFSPLYASGEIFNVTHTNRYTPFNSIKHKRYEIQLMNLSNNKYIITETIINRSHGSAFDKWLEYSQIQAMTSDDIQYLQASSLPLKRKKIITVLKQTVSLSFTLEPHEVLLVEMKPYGFR